MIEVELFTANHIIRGLVETSGERLNDILNDQRQSNVLLEDVRMVRLLNIGNVQPARIFKVSVGKSAILFTRPIART